MLPAAWSHGNPIDILGDADPARYASALEIAATDPDTDGLLVVLTPQDMTDPTLTAQALTKYARVEGKPVLASWMGGAQVAAGVDILNRANIPTFEFPDSAARAFNPDTHLSAYGLGWFLEDYKGKILVHHGGNIDGYTALVAMMPEEKFGVVLLTNMNGTGLPNLLLRKIFDLQLKVPARDWAGDGYKRLQEQQARARQAAARQEAPAS